MSYEQEKIFKKLVSFTESAILSEYEGTEMGDGYIEKINAIKKEWSTECCRRATGEEAAEYMERFVNVMAHNEEEKEFAEKIVHGTHRTLNQSFFGLVFRCIAEEAKCAETGRYDARNESSVKLCKKIMDSHGDQMYLPFI